MRIIAHISDLHFGTVIPHLAQGLIDSLTALKPHLIVISGDLTQRARVHQFQEAQAFLEGLPFPKLIVPGNHDVPLYNVFRRFWRPLKHYRRYIEPNLTPFFQDHEIAVLGINTARSFTFKNGRISEAQMQLIRHYFCAIPDTVFKILITHHPFLPPHPQSKQTLVGRAQRVLHTVEDCNLDMLLSGHFHMSYAGDTEAHIRYTLLKRALLVIQAGTATSSRTRNEQNAYNVIQTDHDHIKLKLYRWDGQRFHKAKEERFGYNQGHWQK